MSDYEIWVALHKFPIDPDASDNERRSLEFHLLSPASRARCRRRAKASIRRRMENLDWRRRQRREDLNGQVVY